MPHALGETVLRTISGRFGGYPCAPTDTLGDGLARALQYADQDEADANAAEDPTRIAARVDALWPRLVEAFDPIPQKEPNRLGHNSGFRVLLGLLDYRSYYRGEDIPTADACFLPNGLPLFDCAAPSIAAVFACFGIDAAEVEACR
ncbi:hypothetical protein [Methylobacterium sp. J-067]|uniref:hypothetical protein n=1 Tax=Methylobacterium sp. J-067 TaxID=2836648 RepID=UPI001FB9E604|nr:hypothetical protein [Methylobacterium sp. J-067]MCJ2023944.1 hypothetical protein [Methylobacterium sp. J-067]